MRIARALMLFLTTSCAGNGVTAPDPSPFTLPGAVRLTSPDLAELKAPDTRGMIVRLPTAKASPRRYDCDCTHVSRPYVMIIDGTQYRFPEDSARLLRLKQLPPSDIESLQVVAGPVSKERYRTDGRPVILIRTKRGVKHP